MTVSIAMLVKDPPLDRLALLLEMLRPAVHETVIVVDDRTALDTVAAMSTWPNVTLTMFGWVDDFAAARNAALPHCTGDWILHLDPDEMPSLAMLDFIRAVDASECRDTEWVGVPHVYPRAFLFWTRNYYGGRLDDGWDEQDWHVRLFRRDAGKWYKPIHEQVAIHGKPEDMLRESPYMPKAPRSAWLIHSRMPDSAEKIAAYEKIAVPA